MEEIVETIRFNDGVTIKIGFREGAWIATSRDGYDRVAVSKCGYLLHIRYRCWQKDVRHAYTYQLFSDFNEMAADDDIDLELMARTAAALGVEDYVARFDA